jgi:uncharacterized membrane protein (DUF2068 family)
VKQKFALHHYFGLRAVAVFEFIKGFAVLLIGLGLLSLIHRDVQEAAENILRTLHLDPAWHYSKKFVEEASQLTDVRIGRLAAFAFAYSTFRMVEAYGLWFEYLWAEWLAVISATIYLPWELQHLWTKPTVAAVCVLLANLVIIAYLVHVLWDSHRARLAMEGKAGPSRRAIRRKAKHATSENAQ